MLELHLCVFWTAEISPSENTSKASLLCSKQLLEAVSLAPSKPWSTMFCFWDLYFYGNHLGHILLVGRQGHTHFYFTLCLCVGVSEGCSRQDEWMCFIFCNVLNEFLKAYLPPYLSVASGGQSVAVDADCGLAAPVHACSTRWQWQQSHFYSSTAELGQALGDRFGFLQLEQKDCYRFGIPRCLKENFPSKGLKHSSFHPSASPK